MYNLTPLEHQELRDRLVASGYGHIVDALYEKSDDQNKVFTKRGRLNKSGACRALGCKTKELEEALRACRQILGEDLCMK